MVRFQPWIVASTAGLIAVVTLVLASVVWWQGRLLAEESAHERFSALAQRVTTEFDAKLQGALDLAHTLAAAQADALPETHAPSYGEPWLPLWWAALERHPHLYGLYVGLDDSRFLQMIAVRQDPRITAALQAPPSTHHSVRRILVPPVGPRLEHWRHFDAQGTLRPSARCRPATTPPSAAGTAMPRPAVMPSSARLTPLPATRHWASPPPRRWPPRRGCLAST
nr:hypothetical protein [Tepidicella xavieri]